MCPGKSYVIGIEFGQIAARAFARVCKIEADNIESDTDVDQLIQALQQTKALLGQLRQQTHSPTQK
jgi:sensor histidine kinase regulating citrate/malate metabolism